MNVLKDIVVHCTRLPSGAIGVWGTGKQEAHVPVQELKKICFAWHEKSFYGTSLETAPIEGKEAIILSALVAMDYLAMPASLLHGRIAWSSKSLLLKRTAEIYRASLEYGWFAPSFDDWTKGRLGWKLILPEELKLEHEALLLQSEEEEILLLKEWFTDIVIELINEQGKITNAWGQVVREHPILGMAHDDEPVEEVFWLDEEQWLIAIGWKQDEIPFRTCLQLIEPEESDSWSMQLILQDKKDPNVLVSVHAADGAGSVRIPESWQEHMDGRLSKDLAACIRVVPWLEDSEHSDRIRMELSDDEAWEFMDQSSLRLIKAGISVFLPSWWEALRQMKPGLKAKIKSSVGSAGKSMFGMDQLIQFDWKVAIGDMDLTEEEFLQMAEEKKRLMLIRGKWIQLDPVRMEQIMSAMRQVQKKRGLSFRDVVQMHLLGGEDSAYKGTTEEDGSEVADLDGGMDLRIQIELNSHLRKLMKQLQQTEAITLTEPPDGLQAELRKYQLEGVSWLLFLRKFGLGGCLADDMGLGKTIQFLAYLLHTRKEARQPPALLICPTSVLGNWQKELERFAPSLKIYLHYGSQRTRGEQFTETASGADLVMTSYNLAHLDEEELSALEWDVICLDEAQNIKNAYTKQASAIRKLSGGQRIALTGTPIENRLTELWSIFDFINPGYLGSLRQFSHRYVNAIENTGDAELTGQVQRLIKPFLLRRVKKDPAIQLDLPDKNEAKTYVSLTVEQGTLYENVVQDLMDRIDDLNGMEKKGLILATLTKLKQICNHPALYMKETGHPAWEDRSNKVTRLLEMIRELREEGDSCLIFTQYVQMGHLLQAAIEENQRESVQFLHGGLAKGKRDELIARFQDTMLPQDDRCGIFILSLKAGGTGLNLTAANHVFHFDRWWNPAVENQATDRAFRIGQTRDVQVHKFVTLGTLEERIDEMIERKQGLSQQIVGSGENWVTEMSTNELKELFALRNEWMER